MHHIIPAAGHFFCTISLNKDKLLKLICWTQNTLTRRNWWHIHAIQFNRVSRIISKAKNIYTSFHFIAHQPFMKWVIQQHDWARNIFILITMAITRRCILVGVTGIIIIIGLIHVYQDLNVIDSHKFASTRDTASRLMYTDRENKKENISSSDTFREGYHFNRRAWNNYSLELPDCPKVYMSY